ncbi:MAG: peptidylprolyl isomerase [Bacteroidia bacterium]|jgi:peptidyl-prolyl cis-trans isomerase SurA|nr:peptidylprolyl isomerase [Bacteroidia bacterium]
MMRNVLIIFLLIICPHLSNAQVSGQVIDEIAAVVGDNIIMQSEIEIEFQQLQKELGKIDDSVKCVILRQKIIERMLLTQAQWDSIPLSEDRVDMELEKRIKYFASQFPGGEKEMESYYGKSIAEIKSSNREKIKQSLLTQEIQGKLMRDVKVTPTDIKKFYNELDRLDSLPYYSAEVELAQLIMIPKVSREAKELAYEKISELRQRILNGENFGTLALLYSDDKLSAQRRGELPYFTRGDMVSEFEAAAYKLKPDSVSKIVETKYGYHILQLIDRKGENISVRHILIRPQIFRSDIALIKTTLDSVLWLIKIDTLTFEEAAKRFSDDESTKSNGGFFSDGQVGSTKIAIDELPKEIFYAIDKLEPGQISEPELITLPTPDRQQAWRVFYVKSLAAPHRANLRDDYQKLQALSLQRKQMQTMQNWITKNKQKYFIQVSDAYKNCDIISEFIKKNN